MLTSVPTPTPTPTVKTSKLINLNSTVNTPPAPVMIPAIAAIPARAAIQATATSPATPATPAIPAIPAMPAPLVPTVIYSVSAGKTFTGAITSTFGSCYINGVSIDMQQSTPTVPAFAVNPSATSPLTHLSCVLPSGSVVTAKPALTHRITIFGVEE